MNKRDRQGRRRLRLRATTNGHSHLIEILQWGPTRCKVRIIRGSHETKKEVWLERAIINRHYTAA